MALSVRQACCDDWFDRNYLMRNTPSITPLPATYVDEVEVKPVNYLRAARIVGERSLTALVFPRHRPVKQAEKAIPDAPVPAERRRGSERRAFSRRIRHAGAGSATAHGPRYDTRAPEERRSSNRRYSDITTRIEEKA
jgi:hypothetical protein